METKLIRLAYLLTHISAGGVERQILKRIRHLDRSLFDIHIVVLFDQFIQHFVEDLERENATVHICRYKRSSFLDIVKFGFFLKDQCFDIIHSVHPRADRQLCLINSMFKMGRIICSELGTRRAIHPKYRFMQKIIDRAFTFRQANRLIANSDFSKQTLLNLNCSASKISVIHNGIDVKHPLAPKNIQEENIKNNDTMIVGLVARLHPIKSPETFVKAAHIVLQNSKHKALQFVIVGEGPLEEEIRGLIQELNISDRCIMTGYSSCPETWIARFNIAVLVSLSESFPNSILEYMAYKKPVIATRVGGVPDIITHQRNGILITPQAPMELAESIFSLLNNPEKAQELGQNGYQHLSDNFSIKKITKQFNTLYCTVLSCDHIS